MKGTRNQYISLAGMTLLLVLLVSLLPSQSDTTKSTSNHRTTSVANFNIADHAQDVRGKQN